MSTIAIACTVTYTGLSATTIPSPTGNRTMATGDKFITDLGEKMRQLVRQQFNQLDPKADTNTTVSITVT